MGQGKFSFASERVAEQCRLDLGTVKIQVVIAVLGPAVAGGATKKRWCI